MKVRAKELGFWGGSRRRPGTVFEVPDGTKLGKWMELADKPAPPPKPKPKVPTTFSEIAKGSQPTE